MLDGNSLPDRYPSQLASNSVIFKQDSDNVEFWYHDAIPWVHYIPFRRDLADLEEKLELVLANDTLMQQTVGAANEFALRRLHPHVTKCYWARLLVEYSRRLVFLSASSTGLKDGPSLYSVILQIHNLYVGNALSRDQTVDPTHIQILGFSMLNIKLKLPQGSKLKSRQVTQGSYA